MDVGKGEGRSNNREDREKLEGHKDMADKGNGEKTHKKLLSIKLKSSSSSH